ncbi:MAG: Putative ABC transporter permease protein [Leptospirillum sp. Group II 'C75']|jgi:ABC-2 type transport system permease protein|uniref:Membrane protein n=3 Tax=Leptospirillum ferriphilum TaxID=178606 RepID=A0A059XUK3_9BACT|nr:MULTISPECIES: ABC transporter permease [Leptospirillum]EAY56307.1 MAG: putative ABC transporter permease protein [Leptospirillum rubarum]EIJ76968.1 MAG: Putative ABC transporter permease protein [Leptospirillum sp. Group II 'C75']AFS53541.1 putative ABC transporter permease protein [Leptospirillum ferriphilum ML-04]AIA30533.1 membrane protein [Leptospirillum ferriphilum YSK]AKS23539.1 membrane protein [Leptospirillum sp. Group II 'CF-1']
MKSAGSLREKGVRIRAMVRKESLQILRDPSSLAIAIVLPVLLLLIFGYGVSLDARHVPIAVVSDSRTPASEGFVAGIRHSPWFVARSYPDIHSAISALKRQDVEGILWLRENFGRSLESFRTHGAHVVVNGVDDNTARLVEGYLTNTWQTWIGIRNLRGRILTFQPISLDARIWFNPDNRSRDFLIPGLIAVIMTLIGALLTSMIIAREWERGTLESLFSTPVTIGEILLGKFIPYFVLGMAGMAISVAMGHFLFDVPLRGTLGVLFLASALFLTSALGMGLVISTVSKNQFVAGQIAIVFTFLPAFILSGFIFDIHSMPFFIRILTHVIPASYFVTILQSIFLAGDIPGVILPNATALFLFSLFLFTLLVRISRKRIL